MYVLCDITSGCWLWTGQPNSYGYGSLYISRQYEIIEQSPERTLIAVYPSRVVQAHRYAWELLVGPIPEGQLICHTCDVRRCVRPDHLFVGTYADNVRDMFAKGRNGDPTNKTRARGSEWQARYGNRRQHRGEALWNAKLTEVDVRTIRRRRGEGITLRELAQDFDVNVSLIGRICLRQAWKHVD